MIAAAYTGVPLEREAVSKTTQLDSGTRAFSPATTELRDEVRITAAAERMLSGTWSLQGAFPANCFSAWIDVLPKEPHLRTLALHKLLFHLAARHQLDPNEINICFRYRSRKWHRLRVSRGRLMEQTYDRTANKLGYRTVAPNELL